MELGGGSWGAASVDSIFGHEIIGIVFVEPLQVGFFKKLEKKISEL